MHGVDELTCVRLVFALSPYGCKDTTLGIVSSPLLTRFTPREDISFVHRLIRVLSETNERRFVVFAVSGVRATRERTYI